MLWYVFVSFRLIARRTAQRLSYYIKRNHVTIWNWIQKYHLINISSKSKKISEYIVDETLLKVGSEYVWLWVGCYLARKQEYSNTIYIKGKKHTHCREIYFRSSEGSWKTSSFHRWRYMVSTSL